MSTDPIGYDINTFVIKWIDTAIGEVERELKILNSFNPDWVRHRINLKEEYLKQLRIVKSNWGKGVYKNAVFYTRL